LSENGWWAGKNGLGKGEREVEERQQYCKGGSRPVREGHKGGGGRLGNL